MMDSPKWTDVAIVVLTGGIVFLAFMQWREMNNSGTQTDKIIAADERLAKANERFAKSMEDTVTNSQTALDKTLGEMKKQSAAMQDAAHAAKTQAKTSIASADAAKIAADTAASQLELAERPWVDASITLDGPFEFNANGANIHLKLALRNSGHSPAQYIYISYLALIGPKGINAEDYREQVCNEATRMTATMSWLGITLFPAVTLEQREGIGIGKEEINSGKASKDVILYPSVVACIAYRPTFNRTSIYHTAYIVDLVKIDSANRSSFFFKIGEDVDPSHLLLRVHPLGAIFAD